MQSFTLCLDFPWFQLSHSGHFDFSSCTSAEGRRSFDRCRYAMAMLLGKGKMMGLTGLRFVKLCQRYRNMFNSVNSKKRCFYRSGLLKLITRWASLEATFLHVFTWPEMVILETAASSPWSFKFPRSGRCEWWSRGAGHWPNSQSDLGVWKSYTPLYPSTHWIIMIFSTQIVAIWVYIPFSDRLIWFLVSVPVSKPWELWEHYWWICWTKTLSKCCQLQLQGNLKWWITLTWLLSERSGTRQQ